MSQTEFHFGKIKPVQIPEGQTLEEWCKGKCAEEGVTEIPFYNKSWEETYRYNGKNKYFIHKRKVYEFIDHHESQDSEYFMKLFQDPDGTITFVGQFYNGGTCFSEMLEEALDEL